MKNFLKLVGVLILIPYVIVAIVVTIFLLNYNKYGVTELGNKTLVKVNDNSLAPTYKEGDLVVVEKTELSDVKSGDYIFFYEENRDKNTIVINFGRVVSTTKVNDGEYTYKLEGDVDMSSEYYIGNYRDAKVYNSLGGILNVLESRWVFLIFIIIPMLFIFLFEIYSFVLEVKKDLKEA